MQLPFFSKKKETDAITPPTAQKPLPTVPRDGQRQLPPNIPAREDKRTLLSLPKLDTKIVFSSSEVSSVGDSASSLPSSAMRRDEQQLSPLRPPRYEVSSACSTPRRRSMSEKIRATPSSLVRHLRTFSNPPSFNEMESTASAYLASRSALERNLEITGSLPRELSPILNLIHAQRLLTYVCGTLAVAGMVDGEKAWIEVEAKIDGNELILWRSIGDDIALESGHIEFSPHYINLIDSIIRWRPAQREITVSQFLAEQSTVIKFPLDEEASQWLGAINLSKFEYISLNEAYTAVLLSLKGAKLSDVHTLLSKKHFIKYEWCNLRIPEISSKWLRVYVAIVPSENNRQGCVEIYSHEKVSKKNLIAYISDVTSAYSVYPEHANLIDMNSIMKLDCQINVSKNFEQLFVHTEKPTSPKALSIKRPRSTSTSSLTSLGSPNAPFSHSRNVSASSSSSFFKSGMSPLPSDASTRAPKTPISQYFKKNMDAFVPANHAYLMPMPHPGVPASETMIRNYIPLLDSFKLYGRPKCLISNKSDPESLLFAFPSLPLYQYLTADDATEVAKTLFNRPDLSNKVWREALKAQIKKKFPDYRGYGDISQLYESLDMEFVDINNSDTALPRLSLPVSKSEQQLNAASSPGYILPDPGDDDYTNITAAFSGHGLEEPFVFTLPLALERSLDPIADMPTPRDELQAPWILTSGSTT